MFDFQEEIVLPDLEKVERLKAEFPHLLAAVEHIKTEKPFTASWSWSLLFLFLEYGKNFKKLTPVVTKLNPLLGPLLWAFSEGISYVAFKLYIHQKDVKIPFIDDMLKVL